MMPNLIPSTFIHPNTFGATLKSFNYTIRSLHKDLIKYVCVEKELQKYVGQTV